MLTNHDLEATLEKKAKNNNISEIVLDTNVLLFKDQGNVVGNSIDFKNEVVSNDFSKSSFTSNLYDSRRKLS